MIVATNHVSFTVADLERSLGFYQGLLRLESTSTFERSGEGISRILGYEKVHIKLAFLLLPGPGNLILEMIEYISPKGMPIDTRTCNPGSTHLCFSVDDLQTTYHALKAEGVRFTSEPQEVTAGVNKGAQVVYLKDPDGHNLELIQPPHSPAQ